MKFLIISQYYPPEIGAAATRWSEYASILTTMGHSVTVVCELPNYPSGVILDNYPKFRYYNEQSDNKLLKIIRVPVWANPRKTTFQRLGFFISFMISASLRALFLPKFDLIIVSSPPLFVGLIASFLRPFKKAKYALDLRDIWPESAYVLGEIKSHRMLQVGRWLERIVYQSVDIFLLAVPGFRTYLDQQHPAQAGKQKLNLINGVSQSFIKLVQSGKAIAPERQFTVLYSGNIGLAQGLETIIDAAQILKDSGIRFEIIGDGAKREELITYTKSLALENITFLSSMSRDLLVDRILSAHVCLVPLIKSPLFLNAIPSKMLEYMAAGKPVIVGIKGEVEKLLEDAGSGVCIEPENSRALSDTILHYKNDPGRCEREGSAGQLFVQNQISKEVIMEDLLRDIV